MGLFALERARPLGKGQQLPAGSIKELELAKRLGSYKRTIAGRYRAIRPDELDRLPPGPMHVSPKLDGELWFLVVDGDDLALCSPTGRALVGNLPVLAEAHQTFARRAKGRTVLAGELFAIRKGGRPRVGDLANATAGETDAEVERMGFMAFDVVEGGDETQPTPGSEYAERLAVIERLLAGGKRCQAVKTELVSDHADVQRLYEEWVDGGKGEGLVIRAVDGRTYKLKPTFTLDAAVIGYTEREDEAAQVRSLLLAVMREDGQFHLVGSCGNLGSDAHRAELYARLAGATIDSNYRYASSSGALFRFVRPEVVVEIKVTDLQNEDSSGKPVMRMVLELGGDHWRVVAPAVGISILHPVLERVRDDKEVNPVDVRAGQILERVLVEDIESRVAPVEKPASEVLRREVFVATGKKQGVRKVLVWRTNKDAVDPEYPAYVVCFVDYSNGRKDPLKREVRIAPDEATAMALADEMAKEGHKRGWAPAET